jgi:hypothetical protein
VTKSGAGVHTDRGKAEDRKLSEIEQSWGSKAVEVEGETAMDLYLTSVSSLKARSSSEGLGQAGLAANYANRQPRFPDADSPT